MKNVLLAVVMLLGASMGAIAQEAPTYNWTPFVSAGIHDLGQMTGTRPIYMQGIEANGKPGKELLLFDPRADHFVVAVIHAEKSGLMGRTPGPGLCIELGFKPQSDMSVLGTTLTVADFNGDGLDDMILFNNWTTTPPQEIIWGRGVQFCQ